MAVACSIILVCSPISIFLEKNNILLESGDLLLVSKCIRELFLMHSDHIKIVDVHQSIVSRFLESELRQEKIHRPADTLLYLKLVTNNPVLAETLITSQCISGSTTDVFPVMASLSLFATDERLSLFLERCLTSVSVKIRAIIQTDISANWMLGAVALKLHMSESLLKKRLKDEGHRFSHLLLEERMRVAINLLCFQFGHRDAVAKKCGYSSQSYFISVFHRYYGAPPDKYVSMQELDF